MDGRDLRLLAALQDDPFASWESVGRAIGISGTATKTRAQRLRAEGVLGGFVARVPAALAGSPAWRVHLGGASADIKAILDAAETTLVARTLRGDVWVEAHVDDAKAFAERIAREHGLELRGVQPRDPKDADGPTPSRAEWNVLRELVLDLRRPLAEVARVAGHTHHTARAVRDRLVARRWLSASVELAPSRATGGQLSQLVVPDEPEPRSLVERALPAAARWRMDGRAGYLAFSPVADVAQAALADLERRLDGRLRRIDTTEVHASPANLHALVSAAARRAP